jgi:hypothetical protein
MPTNADHPVASSAHITGTARVSTPEGLSDSIVEILEYG